MKENNNTEFKTTLKLRCNNKFKIIDSHNFCKILFSILLAEQNNNKKSEITHYEKELLKCIARGECNKEIAEKMYYSVNTIKAQIKRIFSKLKVTARTKSVVVAINRNLIDISEIEIKHFKDLI